MQRLGDEDLMTLVDRKDPIAFEVFYERHGGPAFSLAHRIVGDRQLAEDVAQEAFLSMWRSQGGLRRRARKRPLVVAWASSATAPSTPCAGRPRRRRGSTSTTTR